MIADRYYYNQLKPEQKEIYSLLYKGVTRLDKEIRLQSYYLEQDTVIQVFQTITHDNPHLYYFNQTHIDIMTDSKGTVFLPQYFCNAEQIATYNERVQNCANAIVK